MWSYGRPYARGLVGILLTIIVISGLSVLPAILIRLLVDEAIPNGDIAQLTLLGLGMILVPFINAVIGVAQRWV